MNNIINSQNIEICLQLLFELASCKWYQFGRRAKLKQRIENQFLRPMEARDKQELEMEQAFNELNK